METDPNDALAVALAAKTLRAVELHEEWDSPHAFVTLHWDGSALSVGTWAMILPDVHPMDYGAHMSRLAGERMADHPENLPVAYLLQIEGFGAERPPATASTADRLAFEHARATRTFHELPESRELAVAWCVAVDGRSWMAEKTRGADDIEQQAYGPGDGPGGQMLAALQSVARVTAALRVAVASGA